MDAHLAGLPPNNTTDALAEKVLIGAVEQLRAAQRGSFSSSMDMIASPARFADVLARQASSVRHPATGAGESPAALGDAGFSLLKALHASLDQAEQLVAPLSIAAVPLATSSTEQQAAVDTSPRATKPAAATPLPVRTGDYLGFDPMAYPERCLAAVYATTPMVSVAATCQL